MLRGTLKHQKKKAKSAKVKRFVVGMKGRSLKDQQKKRAIKNTAWGQGLNSFWRMKTQKAYAKSLRSQYGVREGGAEKIQIQSDAEDEGYVQSTKNDA